MSMQQSTPITHTTDKNHLIFNQTVHIQNSLQSLDKGMGTLFTRTLLVTETLIILFRVEGGIYFLLKHFKPKGQKISTKCFSILEYDEIEDGPIALEM